MGTRTKFPPRGVKKIKGEPRKASAACQGQRIDKKFEEGVGEADAQDRTF